MLDSKQESKSLVDIKAIHKGGIVSAIQKIDRQVVASDPRTPRDEKFKNMQNAQMMELSRTLFQQVLDKQE